MRKTLFLTLAAALASLHLQAQGDAAPPVRGSVEWLEGTHDFGAFDEDGGKVSCQFRLVNHMTEPVTVVAARASCGCTTPRFPRQPIAPGDTASIEVAFNPTGRPGRFSKTVNVSLSDGGARKTLTIKGVVIGSSNTLRSRYPVDAGALKLRSTVATFGEVKRGRGKAAFYEVYNAGHSPVQPRWEGLPPYVTATASAPVIAPGEQAVYTLTLTADGEAPYGLLADSAFVALDGQDPVKVDFTAIVEEDFSRLTPGQMASAPQITLPGGERVDFGTFPADADEVTASFTIGNQGKDPLILRRVYTADPAISVSEPSRTKIKKGQTSTVTVTVRPALLPVPLLNGRIQVIANDPQQPITTVRAVGVPSEVPAQPATQP